MQKYTYLLNGQIIYQIIIKISGVGLPHSPNHRKAKVGKSSLQWVEGEPHQQIEKWNGAQSHSISASGFNVSGINQVLISFFEATISHKPVFVSCFPGIDTASKIIVMNDGFNIFFKVDYNIIRHIQSDFY